jgi:putative serine protease PepD
MLRLMVVVCLVLFAKLSEAQNYTIANLRSQPAEWVEKALGTPTQRTTPEHGVTHWRYVTPDGDFVVTFWNGGATLGIPPITGHNHGLTEFDPKLLQEAAKQARVQNDLHSAVGFLTRCASVRPSDRGCRRALAKATTEYHASIEEARLRFESTKETYTWLRVLQEAHEVLPNEPLLGRLWSEGQQNYLNLNSSLAQKHLDSRRATQSAEIAAKVKSALQGNDLDAAARVLLPKAGLTEFATPVGDFRSAVLACVQQQCSALFADGTDRLGTLLHSVPRLETFQPLFDEATTAGVTKIVSQLVSDAISQLAKSGDQSVDWAQRRLLREQLEGRAPVLARSPFVDLSNLGPAPAVATFDLGVIPAACGTALNVSRAAPVLPGGIEWLPSNTATREHIAVKVSDWDCGTSDSTIEKMSVASSYVVGQQQISNPSYAALQVQLQAAQAELNRIVVQKTVNPPANGWAGLAVGLQEGTARNRVNSLLRQLQETSPYLSQPVIGPYTAYKVVGTRTAYVRARVEAIDLRDGTTVSLSVGADAKHTANGVEGVLAGDQAGLQNAALTFRSGHDLFRETSSKLSGDLHEAVRAALGRLVLRRAGTMFTKKESPSNVVAHLLLARDAGCPSASLTPFDAVLSLARSETVTPAALAGLTAADFGISPELGPAKPAKSGAGPLANVLQAVVTIEAATGSGSGFFVEGGRYALTNAHVVGAAAKVKIRTANKSVLLGTVVKTSEEHDLALIEVGGGFPAFLKLGDSDTVDVGADILAVGSPLGLSGTVTKGIVSAVRRLDSGITWLQIDASLNRGNSGGPLVLPDGTVVGVNSWKLRGESIEGLAFAIAVNDAKQLFKMFLK